MKLRLAGFLLAITSISCSEVESSTKLPSLGHASEAISVDTPADLSALSVSGYSAGKQAWVTYQGLWYYQPTCPATGFDGVTVVAAAAGDGGSGCWVRGLGGFPGACSQALWTIDPYTGDDANAGTAMSPLATDRERARRFSSCEVAISIEIDILGNLNVGDRLTAPWIGTPPARVLFDGTLGTVTLYTSPEEGLTSATAQSGNDQATITQDGIDWTTAGPSGSSLYQQQLVVTDGPLTGTQTWITNHTGGSTSAIGDSQLVTVTAPIPYLLTSETLIAGTKYIVRSLPLVNSIEMPYPLDPSYASGAQEQLVILNVSFDNDEPYGGSSLTAIQDPSTQANQVRFIGDRMGGISGTFFAHTCQWQDYSLDIGPGQFLQSYGSVIGGDSECLGGSFCYYAQGTVFVPNADVGADDCLTGAGHIESGYPGGVGCVGSSGDGIHLIAGGTILATYPLWGAGNGGFGINAQSGTNIIYGVLPTITGTSGDTVLGGTTESWAAISGRLWVNGVNAGPQ